MTISDIVGPNPPALVSRRKVLMGLAAAPLVLSACAEETVTRQAVFAASNPDPLARYRLPANATGKEWLGHLSVPTLQRNPQTLALSSGAEDGAFGAGALCGWSSRGGRPDFDIVTGVSTGALIAPFAFLGQEHDETLSRIFVDHDASDIMRLSAIEMVRGGALYNTKPLADLIETYTPDSFLVALAKRHDAGGRLFIATSNLETSQAVIWNMGEIARSGQYDLFRAVLRASSALPGIFSPVSLRFSSGTELYQETHVDGGVHMQLLATPEAAFHAPRRSTGGGHLYLLINNTLDPAPKRASKTPLGISQQALTAMVRASASSSVNTARILAKHHDMGFSYTCVGPDAGAVYDPSDRFSSTYMKVLFQHGFRRAQKGRLWRS